MRIQFLLLLFVNSSYLFATPSDNATLTSLSVFEDCAICLEPILSLQPNYFDCNHNSFHTHCLRRIETCPLCRSARNSLAIEESPVQEALNQLILEKHEEAIEFLLAGDFNSFLAHIRTFERRDYHVGQYAKLVLILGGEALQLLPLLRVRQWGELIDLTESRISRSNTDSTMRTIIRMGPFCPDHLIAHARVVDDKDYRVSDLFIDYYRSLPQNTTDLSIGFVVLAVIDNQAPTDIIIRLLSVTNAWIDQDHIHLAMVKCIQRRQHSKLKILTEYLVQRTNYVTLMHLMLTRASKMTTQAVGDLLEYPHFDIVNVRMALSVASYFRPKLRSRLREYIANVAVL